MKIRLNDFKKKYYKLKDLTRFQTSPRISEESVLEHSGFVAAMVLKLNDIYKFDLCKALKLALLHDYPETEISDIPHNIKHAFPQNVQDQLENLEYDVLRRDIDDESAQGLKEFNDFSSVEGLVVAYADILSVIMYIDREILLGNKEYYLQYVLPSTEKREQEILKLLQPYMLVSLDKTIECASMTATIA